MSLLAGVIVQDEYELAKFPLCRYLCGSFGMGLPVR